MNCVTGTSNSYLTSLGEVCKYTSYYLINLFGMDFHSACVDLKILQQGILFICYDNLKGAVLQVFQCFIKLFQRASAKYSSILGICWYLVRDGFPFRPCGSEAIIRVNQLYHYTDGPFNMIELFVQFWFHFKGKEVMWCVNKSLQTIYHPVMSTSYVLLCLWKNPDRLE